VSGGTPSVIRIAPLPGESGTPGMAAKSGDGCRFRRNATRDRSDRESRENRQSRNKSISPGNMIAWSQRDRQPMANRKIDQLEAGQRPD